MPDDTRDDNSSKIPVKARNKRDPGTGQLIVSSYRVRVTEKMALEPKPNMDMKPDALLANVDREALKQLAIEENRKISIQCREGKLRLYGTARYWVIAKRIGWFQHDVVKWLTEH